MGRLRSNAPVLKGGGLMQREGQGISWGFATPAGVLVIRNWYLLLGALGAACLGLFFLLALVASEHDQAAALVALVFDLYSLWAFVLELRGVRVTDDTVTYPVRLGIESGIFPLFRKTILMAHVLQASSLRRQHGMRVAYVSGEFGQAKILFDTKGGRDRFFAVLTSKFPHVKIYRWT
jgi:hypothetical protein